MPLPARPLQSKRVLASVIIACVLLSLIWFNTNGRQQLHNTYKSLSEHAKQSPTSTTSALTTPSPGIFDEPPNVDTPSPKGKTPSTSNSDKQPDVDAKSHEVTTPSTSNSDKQSDVNAESNKVTTPSASPAPFPPLPPPDDEEYMSICMAGEHLAAHRRYQFSRALSAQ